MAGKLVFSDSKNGPFAYPKPSCPSFAPNSDEREVLASLAGGNPQGLNELDSDRPRPNCFRLGLTIPRNDRSDRTGGVGRRVAASAAELETQP